MSVVHHGEMRAAAKGGVEGRVVFLTGASDGIGQALADLWIARGESPWLHGRRPFGELGLKNVRSERYLRADLASPEGPGGIQQGLMAARVESLDRLVLNAAAGWVGKIGEQSAQSIAELLDVNLWANVELCHRLLPLLERANGRIVFVSSVVSDMPAPDYAVYAATKAALESFARSLRTELSGRVEVQVLSPGATRTGMHAKSGLSLEHVDWKRFPPAEVTAQAIDRAIWSSPRWRTVGLGNRLMRVFGRNMPRTAESFAGRGNT